MADTLGPHPPCPLHPNCRCVLLPETKSWRELGLDIDELEEVARPYTKRTNTKSRRIVEVGFHQGDFHSFYDRQSRSFQNNLVGPVRANMIRNGDISFKDIVNPKTGKLQLVKQLQTLAANPDYSMLKEARKFKVANGMSAVADERVNRLIDKCYV